ncbi:hypothetical protein Q8A67_020492 [Cirrhinus molitorella]|nr:hypothetical protein Q8A67_020492 [Cirrhinus molitorella]
MHWEARRRQQVLDRRVSARVKQEGNQDKKKEESVAPVTSCEPARSSESLEADKQCICKCHAKINRRYTSLQYSQQW